MLNDWVVEACRALDLDPAVLDRDAVLDLAKDAAHGVARPAAPLTTYLVGVAVGRGRSLTEATDAVSALLATWPSPDPS